MDKTIDKIKMMEGRTSSIRKAVQVAFSRAMNHLSIVQDEPVSDLSDVDWWHSLSLSFSLLSHTKLVPLLYQIPSSTPLLSLVSAGDSNVYRAPALTGGVSSSSIPTRTHSQNVPMGCGCCWNECVYLILSTSRLVTVLRDCFFFLNPFPAPPFIVSRQKKKKKP